MNTPLLNDIAFGLVKDKVIEDKVKEYEMTEKQKEDIDKKDSRAKQKSSRIENGEAEDKLEENDLDEVDSEEERIMQKHIQTRMDDAEKNREAQKARLARKYGYYRDIVETEFLDIMIKNQKVVCHFYHDQFERCKIMDKHMTQIADLHPETLFVRINADKTPFFTVKLNIKVNYFFKFMFKFFYLLEIRVGNFFINYSFWKI